MDEGDGEELRDGPVKALLVDDDDDKANYGDLEMADMGDGKRD